MFDLPVSSILAASEGASLGLTSVAIGCGLVIIGAAIGIGLIGSKATEAISRQPEAHSKIFPTMIIAAALIEGVAFFALVICFLVLYWLK
jgi:F-type H+-transporting ATPase subunit c